MYVETLVRCDGQRLWHLTQAPHLHPRRELRFSSIRPTHLDADGHQHFTYSLALPHPRWALLEVTGTGVSVGERRDATGRGTSALRFHPHGGLSPLGEGSGYWRYVPTERGVRFLTGYDYAPGWGGLGRVLDPLLVRPAVGWATAWSFDRLRLWAETGLDPAVARDRSLRDAAARSAVLALSAAAAAGAWRARRWGPLGAAVAAATAAVLRPVGPGTPSARRCLRRAPDRGSATPPANLGTVPFSVENYAYADSFGRETVTVVRTFEIRPGRRRRFDATLVADGPSRVLDYLGTHQHLAVDLRPSVLADGSLRIVSGAQRFYEGPVAFRFPMPLSGTAQLTEGYDDARDRYTIEVEVSKERFGPLAGYSGSFTCEFPEVVGDAVPPAVRPLREERRR